MHPQNKVNLATAINDDDPLTLFSARGVDDIWVGFDFGRPVDVANVVYFRRSDGNNLYPGYEYVLSYWNGNCWQEIDCPDGRCADVSRFRRRSGRSAAAASVHHDRYGEPAVHLPRRRDRMVLACGREISGHRFYESGERKSSFSLTLNLYLTVWVAL